MQIAKYFAKFGIDIDPNVLKNIQTTFDKMQKMAEQMDKKLQKLESGKNKNVLANLKAKEAALARSLDKEYALNRSAASKEARAQDRELKASKVRQERAYKLQNFGREFNPYKAESAAYKYQDYLGEQKRLSALSNSGIPRGKDLWGDNLRARQGVQMWSPTVPSKPSLIERMANNARSAWGAGKTGAGVITGGAGVLSRFGPTALGGAAGFLALKGISDKSQRVQAADLGLESVLAAYGLEGKHDKIFNRYKNFSSSIGVDWLGGADQFNSFLSSAMGMGVSTGKAQDQYEGISSYARAMHLDPYKQKLVMQGLRDMLGKGTVQAEEWKKQIGGNLPGGVAAFAEAYQKMTGGKLTGQASIAQFINDAGKGKISSAPLIENFAEVLKGKSAKGLEVTKTSAQTAQANLSNQFNQMFNLANKGGLDKNFADLFNGLTEALKDLTPAIKSGLTGLGHTLSVLGAIVRKVGDKLGISGEEEVSGQTFKKNLINKAAGLSPNDDQQIYLKNAYLDRRLEESQTAKGMTYGDQVIYKFTHPTDWKNERMKFSQEFEFLTNAKKSSSASLQSSNLSKMTGFNASTMSNSGFSITNSTFHISGVQDIQSLESQLRNTVNAHNSPEAGGK